MNRFIAIKVGRGDAFYLENKNTRFLVDGGASRKKLPPLLYSASTSNDVDILVCTHSDEDHVNGLIGYFESNRSCEEVWLPGSWTSRLEDMINEPRDFIKELFNNIFDLDDNFLIHDAKTLENIGNIISKINTTEDQKSEDDSETPPPILPYINTEVRIDLSSLQDEPMIDEIKQSEEDNGKSKKTEDSEDSEDSEHEKRKKLFNQKNYDRFISETNHIPKNPFSHKKTTNKQFSLVEMKYLIVQLMLQKRY